MNRFILKAIFLSVSVLLIFAGGLAAGRWWWGREKASSSAGLTDPKEEVDKEWIYPNAFTPEKATLLFERGSGVQWSLDHPTAGRTLYYYYTIPEDFEKVVAFYDNQIAAVYNVPAENRLTLSGKEGLRGGFMGARWAEYKYCVEPERLPAGGAAVAVTLSVRSKSGSLSVFIRKKEQATVVTLIYDPPPPK